MTISDELAALVQRMSVGEQLSSNDRARLSSLLGKRGRGRPPRDDLKHFKDEFLRAIVFLMARADNMGDGDAIEKATRVAYTSVRRIRGAVKWLSDLSESDAKDWICHLRSDSNMAKRIAAGGLEALTPKEIYLTGCIIAFTEQAEKMLQPEVRAKLLLRHSQSFTDASAAVIERTGAVLRAMVLAGDLTDKTDAKTLALLVSAVAGIESETQVQKLAGLMH
jgi:hypothetical protein